MVAQGSFGAPIDARRRIAFMRYVGQGHEIPVPLPAARRWARTTWPRSAPPTTREYTRFYDRPVPGSDVEIMSYAVVVATVPDDDRRTPAAGDDACSRRTPRRRARSWCATPRPARSPPWAVYDRAALAPGARIAGPAIIAEDETSTLVGPGWTRRRERPRLYRTDAGDRLMAQRNRRARADPSPDHVEPPDRRRGGAGADHDPHRVLHHGARGRRPVGRHLRPARPHDGAGGHRHARPRQLHGGERRPFPAQIPGRHDAARAITTSPTIPGSAPAICTTSPSSRRPSTTAASSGCSPTPRT